jgi:hypothetical protein
LNTPVGRINIWLFVILLFVQGSIILSIYYEKIIIILLAAALFFLLTITKVLKIRLELLLLMLLILLFFIEEFSFGGAVGNELPRLLIYIEHLSLVLLPTISLCKNGIRDKKTLISLTLLICGFIGLNFISTMNLYNNIQIFSNTTLDYLRYSLLIYYIVISDIKNDEIFIMLKFFSPIVVLGFLLSLFQFLGHESWFHPFIGNYQLQIREGLYRAVGYFPYPIEFANHSLVLFCLYYFLNKYRYKSRWMFFISLLLALNVVFTHTRATMIVLLVILFFDSFKSLKNFYKISTFIVLLLLVLNQFIPIQGVFQSFVNEYSSIERTPRGYYTIEGLKVWSDNPLFGIGFNTFGTKQYREITGDFIFQKYNISLFSNTEGLGTTDTFLAKILPEFGIVGVFMAICFYFMVRKKYMYVLENDPVNKAYALVILSCMILTINSANVLFNPHVGSLFWICIGMIINNSIVIKERALLVSDG